MRRPRCRFPPRRSQGFAFRAPGATATTQVNIGIQAGESHELAIAYQLRVSATWRLWSSSWATLPAVVGPGAAKQPAKNENAAGQPETAPPAGGARCMSATCCTGCPRRGSARSPHGGPLGAAPAPRGWRSGRPYRVRLPGKHAVVDQARLPGHAGGDPLARRHRRGSPSRCGRPGGGRGWTRSRRRPQGEVNSGYAGPRHHVRTRHHLPD
jgi:hypothetical protein